MRHASRQSLIEIFSIGGAFLLEGDDMARQRPEMMDEHTGDLVEKPGLKCGSITRLGRLGGRQGRLSGALEKRFPFAGMGD
jgi:hypothetical protein